MLTPGLGNVVRMTQAFICTREGGKETFLGEELPLEELEIT